MSNEYKPTYVDNTDNSISIMESTDTISFCKTGTKINTLSAKNVTHKKSGEDLNLCAFDGSNFNPIITINNNNQDCRIMTNLNVAGNVNIIGNGIINTSLGIGTTSLNNGFTSSNVHTNSILDINGQTTIRGHILPSINEQFDLGNAEYKIRHLFLSDNSLWIGNEHKIDISNGKMKFKKIKKASDFIPTGLTNNGALQTAISNHTSNQGVSRENYTINDWNIIAKEVGVSNLNQVFKSDNSNNWAEDKEEGAGAVPIGGIIMWSGIAVPPGWALCDGNNGTPDLKGKFIVGTGGTYTIGNTGGADTVTLSEAQMPRHNHNIGVDDNTHSHTGSTNNSGSHSHSGSTTTEGNHSHTMYGSSETWPVGHGSRTGPRYQAVNTNTAGSHSHSFTTSSSGNHGHTLSINGDTHSHSVSETLKGGSLAHENRPPYYALAYIIRIQ